MNAEGVIGIGVVGLLIWWLLHQSQQQVSAPVTQANTQPTENTFSIPSLKIPAITIPTMPMPPDLKPFVFNGPQKITTMNPPPNMVGSNPCDCGCAKTGSTDNVNALINGTTAKLAASLNKIGSDAIKQYEGAIQAAIPDYVKQFMVNPEAVAASQIANAKTSALQTNAPILLETGVGGFELRGGTAGDFYNDYAKGKDGKLGPGVYNFTRRPMLRVGAEYSAA